MRFFSQKKQHAFPYSWRLINVVLFFSLLYIFIFNSIHIGFILAIVWGFAGYLRHITNRQKKERTDYLYSREKDQSEKRSIEKALNDRINKLELLKILFYGFAEIFDLKAIFERIYTLFPQYLHNVQRVGLFMYDDTSSYLLVGMKPGLEKLPEDEKELTETFSLSIYGKCLTERRTFYIEDCSQSDFLPEKIVRQLNLKCVVAVPITFKTKVLGVIRFDNTLNPGSFTPEDIDFFEMAAEQLGVLIENALLFHNVKLTEIKVKESENNLKVLMNSIHVGIMVINSQTKIIEEVNDYALQMLGRKRAEVCGHICHKYICTCEPRHCPAIEGGKLAESVEQIITKSDGTILPVLKSVSTMKRNGKVFFIESFTDIKNLKEAEEALRINEERMSIIFRNISDVLVSFDSSFRLLRASPSISKLTGYEPEELTGKRLSEMNLFSYENLLKITEHMSCVMAGSCMPDNVYEILTKDNSIRNVEIEITKTEISSETALICIARDITERLQAQEELMQFNNMLIELNKKLNRSEKKLKESNYNKDKFMSIISHDLKNPFSSLLGFSDYILSDYDSLSDDEIRLFVQNINSSSKRLFKLLENLLQWSFIQTGRMEYQPVKIDLHDCISSILLLLDGNANLKKIRLKNKVREGTYAFADYYSVNSIIQNLVSNAIKYTSERGVVIVSVAEQDNFYKINVEDNGVGINNEDLHKLFRIDINHSTPGTSMEIGTGLGLILCREMVEKNGGKIWVKSEPGQGTTFSFILPKYLEPANEEKQLNGVIVLEN